MPMKMGWRWYGEGLSLIHIYIMPCPIVCSPPM